MFGNPNSQVLAEAAAKYDFKAKNALHICLTEVTNRRT
jgi:hypothetical protein